MNVELEIKYLDVIDKLLYLVNVDDINEFVEVKNDCIKKINEIKAYKLITALNETTNPLELLIKLEESIKNYGDNVPDIVRDKLKDFVEIHIPKPKCNYCGSTNHENCNVIDTNKIP